MSFHELTSDYPWLTKRMSASIAQSKGEAVNHPRRNIFAWILSFFIPRCGAGGASSLLITIAMIGVLAAVALPAYQEHVEKSRLSIAYSSLMEVKDKVSNFVITNGQWPTSMTDLSYETESLINEQSNFDIGIYDKGMIGIKTGITSSGEEKYIILESEVIEGSLSWKCYGQNIESSQLPPDCR